MEERGVLEIPVYSKTIISTTISNPACNGIGFNLLVSIFAVLEQPYITSFNLRHK